MRYDLGLYRRRFAIWAAARATQRGFGSATVETLRDALESCGVVDFVDTSASAGIDEGRFRELHRGWCRSVVGHLEKRGLADATYGRAAKLVAVYLKSAVVLGPHGDTELARVAHPPIDAILLRNASKATDVRSPHQRTWSQVRWTKLDEAAYYRLIDQLHAVVGAREPFWSLERFWTVTNDSGL